MKEKYLVSIFFVNGGDAFEIRNENFSELEEALDRYYASLTNCIKVGSIVRMFNWNDNKLCVDLYNCSEDEPFMHFEYAPYFV